ncbi:glycosyltransferase family 87 protein [Solwaraspora sp. WMMD791]|uniref:glycosyltransferase family 87 protein n=1 Tax=Solwaraspora sp. WMMD791 TaxID=3016086 RepID=UPI00249A6773|nr:glycosyltransferase family 87 protein [Solwaraspora sp. WMMD791]WFE28044.1 glycosyltransferase family 87 protein [Solwaraspora sp. WMMD791]
MESTRRRRWLLVATAIAWLVSRAGLLAVTAGLLPGLDAGDVFADVELYRRWSDDLRTGQVPVDDPMWQYPPGAAALFVAIRQFAGDSVQAYTTVFVLFALCADLAVTLALIHLARRGNRLDGAVYWVLAVPLLTLLPYARYDIFVTAPAVVALAFLLRRPVLAGAVLAVGALVKVWPAMLLIAARPLRGLRPVAVGFGVALVGSGAALTLAYAGAWSGFTGNQADRGLQVESVAATAFAVTRLIRPELTVSYVYGSMEFVHPVASVVATVLTGSTLVALGVLGWWWLTGRRRTDWTVTTGFDLALLVVLVTVVTSRVLSPQYLLWLLGLAAVCLTRRDTTLRVPAVLIVVATALTSAYFPWFYADVIGDPAWPGVALLAARNLVLLAATGIAVHRLLRRPGPRPAHPVPTDVLTVGADRRA